MSTSTIIEIQGRVEWWFYTVGHGQLLLRRPKQPSQPLRIDIVFKDVVEAHLVSYFDNLRLMEIDSETARATIPAVGRRKLFTLIGDNATGHIVAASVAWTEDDLEYDQPSSLMTQE